LRVLQVGLSFVLLSLVTLVPGALGSDLDSTIVIDTTAEYEAGTFSDSLGQREVSTNACNMRISVDVMALNNPNGDGFCVTDSDAETLYWSHCIAVGAGSSEIVNGTLRLSLVGPATGDRHAVRSLNSWNGNVDMRIKQGLTIPQIPAESQFQVLNEPVCLYNTTGTVDGALYQTLGSGVPGSYTLTAFTITDGGVAGVCGAAPTFSTSPVWKRIVHVDATNTWTFYYSFDGIAWTLHGSCVATGIGPFYTSIEQADNGNSLTIVDDFDDWNVFSDSVLGGRITNTSTEYRTTGIWYSEPFEIVDGQRLARVAITHSGLSTDSFIDQVDFEIDGSIVETFPGDINTGTITYLYSDSNRNGEARIGIRLAGNGSLTPQISQVEIVLTEGGNVLDEGMIAILLLVVWLALVVLGLLVPSGTLVLIGSFTGIAASFLFVLPVNLIAAIVLIGGSVVTLVIAIGIYMEGNA
jgi:hypothetical protein